MKFEFEPGDYVEVLNTIAGRSYWDKKPIPTRMRFYTQELFRTVPKSGLKAAPDLGPIGDRLSPSQRVWVPRDVNGRYAPGDKGIVLDVKGGYVKVQLAPSGRGWVPRQQLTHVSPERQRAKSLNTRK
jgi:hypothetical protein